MMGQGILPDVPGLRDGAPVGEPRSACSRVSVERTHLCEGYGLAADPCANGRKPGATRMDGSAATAIRPIAFRFNGKYRPPRSTGGCDRATRAFGHASGRICL